MGYKLKPERVLIRAKYDCLKTKFVLSRKYKHVKLWRKRQYLGSQEIRSEVTLVLKSILAIVQVLRHAVESRRPDLRNFLVP